MGAGGEEDLVVNNKDDSVSRNNRSDSFHWKFEEQISARKLSVDSSSTETLYWLNRKQWENQSDSQISSGTRPSGDEA